MYAQFFGLKREPFSIAPDPRYLFMSERHREALAHLLYGVKGGGGFVLLTGEIGAGKTTVCRCFLEQVPRRCNVAYILNPKQTVEELLQSVCEDFRIPVQPLADGQHGTKSLVDALNDFLLRTHAVGQNNVLIIDEAQNLSVEVLEQLRLLTNLETSERKLLQIILIGQPELRDMLERPELEQLAQRVIARYHLEALSTDETSSYVRHRLEVAGLTSAVPFSDAALRRIHELSRGVPRRINLLADRALLGAYARGRSSADERVVEKAAAEVFGTGQPTGRRARARRRAQWRTAGVLALGLLIGALLTGGYAWMQSQREGDAGSKPALAAAPGVAPKVSMDAEPASAPASTPTSAPASAAASTPPATRPAAKPAAPAKAAAPAPARPPAPAPAKPPAPAPIRATSPTATKGPPPAAAATANVY